MNVQPLTVEMILRTNRRDRPLLVGWLIESLLDAAQKIAPDFMPEREPKAAPLYRASVGWTVPVPPPGRLARWLRRMPSGDEASDSERGQGLAEYALILALVAILVVVAVLLIGSQISGVLSTLGNSIQ